MSTAKKTAGCNCIDAAQKAAKKRGFAFVLRPSFNAKRKEFSMAGPFLAVERIDGSRKPRPVVSCSYCPFCGKRKP